MGGRGGDHVQNNKEVDKRIAGILLQEKKERAKRGDVLEPMFTRKTVQLNYVKHG